MIYCQEKFTFFFTQSIDIEKVVTSVLCPFSVYVCSIPKFVVSCTFEVYVESITWQWRLFQAHTILRLCIEILGKNKVAPFCKIGVE